MKKLLKENLKIIIIIAITSIVATTTTIFAYSLIASEVGFIPKDTTWEVDNVETAINDLYKKVTENIEATNVGSCIYTASPTNPSCSISYTAKNNGIIIIDFGSRAAGSAMSNTSWNAKIDGVIYESSSRSTWGMVQTIIMNVNKNQVITFYVQSIGNNTAVWAHMNFVKK